LIDCDVSQEIDTYIDRATEHGYSAFLTLGARALTLITNVILTGAAKGQTTLAEHLSRAVAEADPAGEGAMPAEGEGLEDGGDGVDDGDSTPRRRRRGRGRTSECADADESANEILRAAYRREVTTGGP